MPVFRAKESFAFTDADGVPRVITAGTPISSDDPEYKVRRHLFEPLELAYAANGVEEATAEPGVFRRRRGRPPKDRAEAPEAAPEPEPQPQPEPQEV